MNTAEAGINWIIAVIAAPFVAILFAAVVKMINVIYQSTRVHDGPFSQAQSTVHQGALASIDLLRIASSIETWVFFAIFIVGLFTAAKSLSSGR